MFLPAIKAAAQFHGPDQHRCQAPVSPGKDTLHKGKWGVLPLEVQFTFLQVTVQLILALPDLIHGNLRFPLEGGVGLGNKGADCYIDLTGIARNFGLILDLACHNGYLLHIFGCLSGQPDHEVEFDRTPARTVNAGSRLQQVGLGDALVDHLAHTFATGFRGQGKAGLANLLDLGDQLIGQRADS